MTLEILLLLILLVVALVLFALEKLPVDLITLVLLAALVVLGILEPAQAFSGFANEIIVILASIFVISGALVKTGVMDWLGAVLHRLAGDRPGRLMQTVMLLSASGSAFLSNTNTTAILMPAVMDLSKRARISASRLLMPLAYASILGGACTLIGTSTNMAASGMIRKLGLEPFSVFEFTAAGLAMAVAGIVYLSVIGWRLLPSAPPVSLAEEYRIREYLAHLVIPEGSVVVGKTLAEARLAGDDTAVLSIARGERRLYPQPYTTLRAGDLLTVQASREGLLAAQEDANITLAGDQTVEAPAGYPDQDLRPEEVDIAEAVVLPQATLVGRTLKGLGLGIDAHRSPPGKAAEGARRPRGLGHRHRPGRVRRRVPSDRTSPGRDLGRGLPLHLHGGGVHPYRVAAHRSHRWNDLVRSSHGVHGRRRVPRRTDRRLDVAVRDPGRDGDVRSPDHRPYATDVERRGGARRPAGGALHGDAARRQPAHLRRVGHSGCLSVFHHAVRAGLSSRLWAGKVSLRRFPEGRAAADGADGDDPAAARAGSLAAVRFSPAISKRSQTAPHAGDGPPGAHDFLPATIRIH
jgi:hypothetical protein